MKAHSASTWVYLKSGKNTESCIVSTTTIPWSKIKQVQRCVASFVINRYAKMADAIGFGWLPVKERNQFHLLRTTHTALYDTWLAELFNYGETSNYQESTLKSYIATGHVSWNRNFSRSSLQVILQSAKWHQT